MSPVSLVLSCADSVLPFVRNIAEIRKSGHTMRERNFVEEICKSEHKVRILILLLKCDLKYPEFSPLGGIGEGEGSFFFDVKGMASLLHPWPGKSSKNGICCWKHWQLDWGLVVVKILRDSNRVNRYFFNALVKDIISAKIFCLHPYLLKKLL